MRRSLPFLVLAGVLGWITESPARADMDDIELRKARAARVKLGFAFIGLYETSFGLNRDRPEGTSLFYLAPQLKIGEKMRARLNFGFMANYFLDTQSNPWDFMDLQLQLGHLGLYREKHTGVDFSGHVRYYVPISKASREAGSFGQLRGTGKLSRTFWNKLYLAFELNLQKYFARYTTTSTLVPEPGTVEWKHHGARDEYIENNASYGFGETFTVTYTPIPGLDLSVIYGLMQARQFGGSDEHPEWALDGRARMTRWDYATRLYLDATVGLSMLPWWKGKFFRDQILERTYLSIGYANLSPQLWDGHTHYTPFDPRFAQAYLDLMILY
jgi:hypothetical protein